MSVSRHASLSMEAFCRASPVSGAVEDSICPPFPYIDVHCLLDPRGSCSVSPLCLYVCNETLYQSIDADDVIGMWTGRVWRRGWASFVEGCGLLVVELGMSGCLVIALSASSSFLPLVGAICCFLWCHSSDVLNVFVCVCHVFLTAHVGPCVHVCVCLVPIGMAMKKG